MHTAHPRRWTALAVIALAQFMVIMDTSIIGVALPEIQADVGFSPEETGLISIAIDGGIERGLTAEQLRARLRAPRVPRRR